MWISIRLSRDRAKQLAADMRSVFGFFDLCGNTEVKIHGTIILTLVLYGCGTRSSTLKVEHRLRVLENRVLRKMRGRKRDGVTGEWRRLNNEFNYVCVLLTIHYSGDLMKLP